MLRIAICDDELYVAKQISKNIKKEFTKFNIRTEISIFIDGINLLNEFSKEPFDILFLDIFMPKPSGFDIAKEIRAENYDCYIIFVTAKDDLVYDSFDYRPFQFIRKEDAYEPDISKNTHFAKSIQYTISRLVQDIYGKQKLILQDDNQKKTYIFPREIEYIESDKHYLKYHLRDGSILTERANISDKYIELANSGFTRIQKKYLINLSYVKQLDNEYGQVIMTSGKKLPLSRIYKPEATEAFKMFMRYNH